MLAFAANGWPISTSLTENLWQWCLLATPLQQLLGMNVAATHQWTLDVQPVVDAKQNRRGNWVGRPRLAGFAAFAVVAAAAAAVALGCQRLAGLAVELAVAVAVELAVLVYQVLVLIPVL